jgi:hypothetical protein
VPGNSTMLVVLQIWLTRRRGNHRERSVLQRVALDRILQ